MKQSKKYQSQVVQTGDSWTAEIVRRVTARRTSVSKKQDGFATEDEAKAWAEEKLAEFLASQTRKNKRGRTEKASQTKA